MESAYLHFQRQVSPAAQNGAYHQGVKMVQKSKDLPTWVALVRPWVELISPLVPDSLPLPTCLCETGHLLGLAAPAPSVSWADLPSDAHSVSDTHWGAALPHPHPLTLPPGSSAQDPPGSVLP